MGTIAGPLATIACAIGWSIANGDEPNPVAKQEAQTADDGGGGYHGHGALLSFTPFTGTYQIDANTYRSLTSDAIGDYTSQMTNGIQTGTFRCPGN